MNHQNDRCGYCGACVAVCTRKVIILEEFGIMITPGCEECGHCLEVCPLGAFSVMGAKDEV